MSLDKFLPGQQPQFFSLLLLEHLNSRTFINFLMKLFPAQTHLLKYRHDLSDYCNQLFLLPTANLKRFP